MKTNEIFCTFEQVDVEIVNIEIFKSDADVFTEKKISERVEMWSKGIKGKFSSSEESLVETAKFRFITCTVKEAIDKIISYTIDMHTEHDESY